jgi:4-hydroxybenzoate polyprenyltransferase
VTIAAIALCVATESLLLNKFPSLFTPLHVFIGGGVLFVYNLHNLVKKGSEGDNERFKWSQKNKKFIFFFTCAGGCFSLITIFYLPTSLLFIGMVSGFISLAYSIPILKGKGIKRLKDYGLWKPIILSFIWTIVTVVFPIVYWNKDLGIYLFELMMRFVFILPLCIVFDIRDMETDKLNKIRTLPQVIGTQNCYTLTYFFMNLFFILSIVQYIRYPYIHRLIAAFITLLLGTIAINHSSKNHNYNFSLLVIDGLMIIYPILVWVLSGIHG